MGNVQSKQASKAHKSTSPRLSISLHLLSLLSSLSLALLFACALQYEHRVQLISLSRAFIHSLSRLLTVLGICQFAYMYCLLRVRFLVECAPSPLPVSAFGCHDLSRSSCLLSERSTGRPHRLVSTLSIRHSTLPFHYATRYWQAYSQSVVLFDQSRKDGNYLVPFMSHLCRSNAKVTCNCSRIIVSSESPCLGQAWTYSL